MRHVYYLIAAPEVPILRRCDIFYKLADKELSVTMALQGLIMSVFDLTADQTNDVIIAHYTR